MILQEEPPTPQIKNGKHGKQNCVSFLVVFTNWVQCYPTQRAKVLASSISKVSLGSLWIILIFRGRKREYKETGKDPMPYPFAVGLGRLWHSSSPLLSKAFGPVWSQTDISKTTLNRQWPGKGFAHFLEKEAMPSKLPHLQCEPGGLSTENWSGEVA